MALAHTLAALLENPVGNFVLNGGLPIAVFVIVLAARSAPPPPARHQTAS